MRLLVFSSVVLMVISCTDDDARAWHDEQGKMLDSISISECDEHRQDYWRYSGEIERLAGLYSRRLTEIAMVDAPEHVANPLIDDATNRYMSQLEAWTDKFDSLTGWKEDQYFYCSGRFQVERHRHDRCDQYENLSDGQKTFYHLGAIGRCIDYQLMPLE